MKETKYLIYLDILGFQNLPEKIATQRRIASRKIRNDFINVIEERISIIKQQAKIIGYKFGDSDYWILITDCIDNVFSTITDILDHNTDYEDYQQIPLEIVVGTGNYDKWAKFEGKHLIVEKDTIKFLKADILSDYHKQFKDQTAESPTSTFILFTNSAFQQLEPIDKKMANAALANESSYFIANVDSIKQRGNVFKFLELIQHPGSKWYSRIDTIYVPPIEYEDIKSSLKEKKIVFITGTPEYGKTYTAVRLMWEFFNGGYTPRWIKGEEALERREGREILEDIKRVLLPCHIIYFEDPFGKFEYEKRDWIERQIGTIIDTVQQVTNSYIIITSREEVFKEFEKECFSVDKFREIEKKLNIKKPSYTHEAREEIISRWGEEQDCLWYKDENLKSFVLAQIIAEKLPTPLNIKNFAIASRNTIDIQNLNEQINIKSEETSKAFAKEIEHMSDDKVIFLSLLFIFWRPVEINLLEPIYQEFISELNLSKAESFKNILNWFENDKVNAVLEPGIFFEFPDLLYRRGIALLEEIPSHLPRKGANFLWFSHPSYYEAIKYLLIKNDKLSDINKRIISPLLLKLPDWASVDVARTLSKYFTYLHRDVRDKLLMKLSKTSGGQEVLVIILARHFSQISEKTRNNLLTKLADLYVKGTSQFGSNIDLLKLDSAFRLQLVASPVPGYRTAYEIFTPPLLSLGGIQENSNKRFEKYNCDDTLAVTVAENWKRIPDNIRNPILKKLCCRDSAVGAVSWIVSENYGDLSAEFRDLLNRLSEKHETACATTWAIVNNFDKLPERVRNNLLLKLSRISGVLKPLAVGAMKHYKKVPLSIKLFPINMAENEDTALTIAVALSECFDELPTNLRSRLLLKLSERNSCSLFLAWVIVENFEKLSKKEKKILDKIQNPLEELLSYLSKANGEEALRLIMKVLLNIKHEFVSNILNELRRSGNDLVKNISEELLKVIGENVKTE